MLVQIPRPCSSYSTNAARLWTGCRSPVLYMFDTRCPVEHKLQLAPLCVNYIIASISSLETTGCTENRTSGGLTEKANSSGFSADSEWLSVGGRRWAMRLTTLFGRFPISLIGSPSAKHRNGCGVRARSQKPPWHQRRAPVWGTRSFARQVAALIVPGLR
jgi:hypothetical protein